MYPQVKLPDNVSNQPYAIAELCGKIIENHFVEQKIKFAPKYGAAAAPAGAKAKPDAKNGMVFVIVLVFPLLCCMVLFAY